MSEEFDRHAKLDIEFDGGTVNVEHDVGWITLGILCLVLWAPCWWYDNEIRCALGYKAACAKLELPQSKPAN